MLHLLRKHENGCDINSWKPLATIMTMYAMGTWDIFLPLHNFTLPSMSKNAPFWLIVDDTVLCGEREAQWPPPPGSGDIDQVLGNCFVFSNSSPWRSDRQPAFFDWAGGSLDPMEKSGRNLSAGPSNFPNSFGTSTMLGTNSEETFQLFFTGGFIAHPLTHMPRPIPN